MNRNHLFRSGLLRLFLLIAALGLAGCVASAPLPPASPTPAMEAEATPPPAVDDSTTTGTASTVTTDTLTVDLLPPVQLTIPEIEMDIAISPMSWRVVDNNGVRTTAWVLPEVGAGWHPNSAGAGAAGNVVISGHQLLGDAAFAPIALGDVEVGQEILLTNANGERFRYEVVEVTEPLPITGNAADEQAIAERYMAQTSTPTLTLISGWPDFSTTHRVIVVAELIAE